ncbi:hypothetical protein P9272_32605 [Mesorhizobium sp. WSM4976]|jgi:hypothetical protein|uniref:hypothetical protein n=1 Tax=Mesorhizobium sp. WSM4976 TaxID=3038549 RepID=UPI002416152D|nr:hypothetical protein [Mesorhizobium sp. WSM4976]MDG4898276.1 hypothetical protein [Mesorhizobium sp. WSM4976]
MLDRHIAETHSYSIPEMEALGMQELIEMRYFLETPCWLIPPTRIRLGVKASSLEEMIADTLRIPLN